MARIDHALVLALALASLPGCDGSGDRTAKSASDRRTDSPTAAPPFAASCPVAVSPQPTAPPAPGICPHAHGNPPAGVGPFVVASSAKLGQPTPAADDDTCCPTTVAPTEEPEEDKGICPAAMARLRGAREEE